ncbi:DNA-formamidopyrimidine glycosylase family protein [Mucilaginibacter aquaedulcis]|uniref:DNA-formamidopyrimidine glycosylase family protein n=1 Tax=Mucilaginibacter aquaedulcis TaxID=1187081 RepID=UPI0025B32C77|nr:DNA-formamidopyrimidine glycosylase family protein [Mucilaginibacter aquaedulcis]MDN3551220.1 DNA-formamidopyrimidine glycosylase family protein [Mucilaginibacter aquaedulcis]
MPEIPDLNIFCTNLAERLVGKKLKDIRILIDRRLKLPEADFKTALEAHKLVAINRVGKQLYFEFANKHVLSLQLMLYGSMHWYEGKNDNKFTIAELQFSDGIGLAITDWQKAVILSLDPEVSKVPDALHLPVGYLVKALKGKNKPIKTVLQEGKVVQGIGNAYVDEILYAANLSPFSIAAKIPEKKIGVLTKAIEEVLVEAEAHIRKNFPDTITEKERDFLKVHLPKHKVTPKGEPIIVAEIASRKTYYTEGQELFE